MTCPSISPEYGVSCHLDDTKAAHHAGHRSVWVGDRVAWPTTPEDHDRWDNQPPTLDDLYVDLAAGRAARDKGEADAEAAPRVQEWTAAARTALRVLAATGDPFTSDDLTAAVGLPPGHGVNKSNVVGAVIGAASRTGLIRKTGRTTQAGRVVSHARTLQVWTGANSTPNSTPANPRDTPDPPADHATVAAQLAAVKALHNRVDLTYADGTPADSICDHDSVPWPCPTAHAIATATGDTP